MTVARRQDQGLTAPSTASTTVTLPSAALAGSLLLAFAVSSSPPLTVPSGFTLLRIDTPEVGTNAQIWWKVAAGGETALTWTWPAATAVMQRVLEFTGTDATSPVGVSDMNTTGAAAPVAPSLTPTRKGMLVTFLTVRHSSIGTVATPAGMTFEAAAADATTKRAYGIAVLALSSTAATGTETGAFSGTIAAGSVSLGQAVALKDPQPTLPVWTGTAWLGKPVSLWDGSAWVQVATVQRWNGSAWVDVS